jgi:hypothetical protein
MAALCRRGKRAYGLSTVRRSDLAVHASGLLVEACKSGEGSFGAVRASENCYKSDGCDGQRNKGESDGQATTRHDFGFNGSISKGSISRIWPDETIPHSVDTCHFEPTIPNWTPISPSPPTQPSTTCRTPCYVAKYLPSSVISEPDKCTRKECGYRSGVHNKASSKTKTPAQEPRAPSSSEEQTLQMKMDVRYNSKG